MIYIYVSKWLNNISRLKIDVLKNILEENRLDYSYITDSNDVIYNNHTLELLKDVSINKNDLIIFINKNNFNKKIYQKYNCLLIEPSLELYSKKTHFTILKSYNLLMYINKKIIDLLIKDEINISDNLAFIYCNSKNNVDICKEDSKKCKYISFNNNYCDYNSFLNNLKKSKIIYTDTLDMILLSFLLNKKIKYYSSFDIDEANNINNFNDLLDLKIFNDEFISNKNLEKVNNLNINFRNILINIYNNKLDNFEESRTIIENHNNLDIIDYSCYIYNNNKIPIYFYNYKNNNKNIYDFTVIQVFFNNNKNKLHINAIKNSIEYNLKYSNDLPKEWIFIEYDTEEFRYLEKYGIKYYHIEKNSKSNDLFLKECLWNIAWKTKTNSENLCFIDGDVVYLNCDWVKKTYEGFLKYDVFQNYSYALRSESNDYNTFLYLSSLYSYTIKEKSKDPKQCATGLNICLKRDVLEKINGFPNCCNCGGDFLFVNLMISKTEDIFPIYLNRCIKKGYQSNYIFNRELKIGYCDTIILHYKHGKFFDNYDAFNMLQRRCGSYYSELININEQGLIEWTENSNSKILHKCLQKISNNLNIYQDIDNLSNKIEEIIEDEVVNEYGRIDDTHPLLIVTTFNPGVNYKTEYVQKTRDLFKKYCLNKHDFICITNENIEGVKCIKPKDLSNITSAEFQMEMWRCDYYNNPNTSVLYVDLDIVPINFFKLPKCPDNTIWMFDENQLFNSYGTKYNFGCIYFNGNYNFIYKKIVQNYDLIFKYYNDLQPFVTHLLLENNIKIHNLYNFINLKFYYDNGGYCPYTTNLGYNLIHCIGRIKPWNFCIHEYDNNITSDIIDLMEKYI